MCACVLIAATPAVFEWVGQILAPVTKNSMIRLINAGHAEELAAFFMRETPDVLVLFPVCLNERALQSMGMLKGRGTNIICVGKGGEPLLKETYGCPVSRFFTEEEAEKELPSCVMRLIRMRQRKEERVSRHGETGSRRILTARTEEPVFAHGVRQYTGAVAAKDISVKVLSVKDTECALSVCAASDRAHRHAVYLAARYLHDLGADYRIGVSGVVPAEEECIAALKETEDMILRQEVCAGAGDAFKRRLFFTDDLAGKEYLSRHAAVQAACRYIGENYTKPLMVSEIAASAYVSRNYLCTVFQEDMGVSVKTYLEKFRLHKARYDLLSGGRTVKNIAKDNGFCNSSYFAKRFSEEYGIPPRAYHKEYVRKVLEYKKNMKDEH